MQKALREAPIYMQTEKARTQKNYIRSNSLKIIELGIVISTNLYDPQTPCAACLA